MTRQAVLEKLESNIGDIRRQFSVKELGLFGSVARDEAGQKSDVDVLVEFVEKSSFDLFMDLKFYLEELLGAGVDLVTNKALRPQIRESIERELINVA